MNRRHFLLCLSAAPAAVAASWDDKEFPNWTSTYIDKLLTDSPWAKPITVPFIYSPPPEKDKITSDLQSPLSLNLRQIEIPSGVGVPRPAPRTTGGGWPGSGGPGAGRFPGGGSSGPSYPPMPVKTEAYLTIRWSSALPIRQALALREFGPQGLESEGAQEILKRREGGYLVEIFGFPARLVTREASDLEKGLAKTAKLYIKGGKSVSATYVRVPEFGMHLGARLHFPAFDDLSPEDTVLNLYAEGGTAKIEQSFKLRSMVYRGKLEL